MPSVLNTFKPCKHEISLGGLLKLISSRAACETEIADSGLVLSDSDGLNNVFNVMRIRKMMKNRKLMMRVGEREREC